MMRRILPLRRAGMALAFLALAPACIRPTSLETALKRAESQARSSVVLASDGSVLATLHDGENREPVRLAEVPLHVRRAILAAEDARFYRHGGLDGRAILRAMLVNARERRTVQGGSTITQQYVKNALLTTRERSFKRKVREATLAIQLERRFSKDEILERYLNTVYFGQGAYGIEAAAKTFFGKPARRLTLTEGALLAGLIKAPARYDPLADPRRALRRRNFVLSRMHEVRYITRARLREARARRVRLDPSERRHRHPAPYFVDYVKELIQEDPRFRKLGGTVGERIAALFRGGLRIETTLDPRLQQIAERASRTVLPDRQDPYNAFVAMDPRDGGIVAMVGGRDFFSERDPYAKFNLAVKSRRQAGSAFKPFTLMAALERGISLERGYYGGRRVRIPTGAEVWDVENYGGLSFGGRLSLRSATAHSVNVVYAQVVDEVGPARVVEVARRMGITSRLRPYHSIALGTQEVSPLEMASAYATLASGGKRVPPLAIRRIVGHDGRVLYRARPKPKRVLDPVPTALAIDALQGVMRAGTGRHLEIGRAAAGKTGTTERYADAWFAGFVPQLVAVSWVGFPRAQIPMVPPRTRIRVTGGSWPGQIWQRFMIRALEGRAVEPFPTDAGRLVRVRIDALRECLPNAFTPPALVKERLYIAGSEPKEVCAEPRSAVIAQTPDVVGRAEDVARRTLEEAGFLVSVLPRACPAYAEGFVCAQDPPAAERARVGDRAILYVSDDEAIADVPMVLGRTEAAATAALEDAGFAVEVVLRANGDGYGGCREPEEPRAGRVWAQDPCAGDDHGIGAAVRIFVNP